LWYKLHDSRLRDSKLHDSRLRDSKLHDSRLRDSKLHDSRLRDSKLRNSKLRDSKLHDSRLHSSSGIRQIASMANTAMDHARKTIYGKIRSCGRVIAITVKIADFTNSVSVCGCIHSSSSEY
jgi:uncharacterized protein YjbI with pentapeptide repeats